MTSIGLGYHEHGEMCVPNKAKGESKSGSYPAIPIAHIWLSAE